MGEPLPGRLRQQRISIFELKKPRINTNQHESNFLVGTHSTASLIYAGKVGRSGMRPYQIWLGICRAVCIRGF